MEGGVGGGCKYMREDAKGVGRWLGDEYCGFTHMMASLEVLLNRILLM